MLLLLTLACTPHLPSALPTAGAATPALDPSTVVLRDLRWSPEHGVDVYLRDDDEPKRLLVFVHGGSWVGGDKDHLAMAPGLVDWFLDRNVVVAAVDFPLASRPDAQGPRVTPLDQSRAVTKATAWVRDQSEAWGVTDRRPVWMGFSSGAHLVALAAADEEGLAAAGMTRSDVAAVVSLDVHAYDATYALEQMRGSAVAKNIRLIEHLFGTTTAEQQRHSPAHLLGTEPMPPSLIVSADPSARPGSKGRVARDASARYQRLLTDRGDHAVHVHFDDETHNGLVRDFGRPGDGPTEAVEAFLR